MLLVLDTVELKSSQVHVKAYGPPFTTVIWGISNHRASRVKYCFAIYETSTNKTTQQSLSAIYVTFIQNLKRNNIH